MKMYGENNWKVYSQYRLNPFQNQNLTQKQKRKLPPKQTEIDQKLKDRSQIKT